MVSWQFVGVLWWDTLKYCCSALIHVDSSLIFIFRPLAHTVWIFAPGSLTCSDSSSLLLLYEGFEPLSSILPTCRTSALSRNESISKFCALMSFVYPWKSPNSFVDWVLILFPKWLPLFMETPLFFLFFSFWFPPLRRNTGWSCQGDNDFHENVVFMIGWRSLVTVFFIFVSISTPCSITNIHACWLFFPLVVFFWGVRGGGMWVTCDDATGKVLCLGPEYQPNPHHHLSVLLWRLHTPQRTPFLRIFFPERVYSGRLFKPRNKWKSRTLLQFNHTAFPRFYLQQINADLEWENAGLM